MHRFSIFIALTIWSSVVCVHGQLHDENSKAHFEFLHALQKAEASYRDAIRNQITQAKSVELLQLSPKALDSDPFGKKGEKVFYFRPSDQSYEILESKKINDPKEILSLVHAILPIASKPFAMSIPSPQHALRFFNADGKLIYETTICIDGKYIQMGYPRYVDRVGIDDKSVKRLLNKYGMLKPRK